MKKITEYLQSIGFEPSNEVSQSNDCISYKHSYSGDAVWINHRARFYEGTYMGVYTDNAINTFSCKLSRMTDVIKWIEVHR